MAEEPGPDGRRSRARDPLHHLSLADSGLSLADSGLSHLPQKMAPMKAAKKPMTTIAKGKFLKSVQIMNRLAKIVNKEVGVSQQGHHPRWQDPAVPVCGPCKAA